MVIGELTVPAMTIAVDWDPGRKATKQTNKTIDFNFISIHHNAPSQPFSVRFLHLSHHSMGIYSMFLPTCHMWAKTYNYFPGWPIQ